MSYFDDPFVSIVVQRGKVGRKTRVVRIPPAARSSSAGCNNELSGSLATGDGGRIIWKLNCLLSGMGFSVLNDVGRWVVGVATLDTAHFGASEFLISRSKL